MNDTTHKDKEVTLPIWLDDMLFKDMKAIYNPQMKNISAVDYTEEEWREYLGTYFPRSFAESYSIISDYLEKNKEELKQDHLNIFDFGCGTGGEIIGTLCALQEKRNSFVKSVRIYGVDGNNAGKDKFIEIIKRIKNLECSPITIEIKGNLDEDIIVEKIENAGYFNRFNKGDERCYDIVLCFKVVNEFISKGIFKPKPISWYKPKGIIPKSVSVGHEPQDGYNLIEAYNPVFKYLYRKLKTGGTILLLDIGSACYIDYKKFIKEVWHPDMLAEGIEGFKYTKIRKHSGEHDSFNVKFLHSEAHPKNGETVGWALLKK